jgi:hypothetical protein
MKDVIKNLKRNWYLIVIVLTVWGFILADWSDCDGQYVRGLIWYECMGVK